MKKRIIGEWMKLLEFVFWFLVCSLDTVYMRPLYFMPVTLKWCNILSHLSFCDYSNPQIQDQICSFRKTFNLYHHCNWTNKSLCDHIPGIVTISCRFVLGAVKIQFLFFGYDQLFNLIRRSMYAHCWLKSTFLDLSGG